VSSLLQIAAAGPPQIEQARSSHRLIAACAKVSPDRSEPNQTVRISRSIDDLAAQAFTPA
jgi:hypothetical protein